MASLREEITKTVRRLARAPAPADANLSETVIRPDPREGTQIGAYRVIRRLGSGGMGHVYLALDSRLGRHVALKFLSSELIADSSMLFRLQQEARSASALNHPNILTIYEIVEINGEYFIASEFIDGANLRNAMQRQALNFQAALDIATQLASALVAAHSAGVVHRDLKPGNIMLRSDGYVKIIDFGLAKNTAAKNDASESQAATQTLSGGVVGTVRYMSPEQARGEAVDHRTDLWSLGVVLYEMVANRRPFEGNTESHVVVAILDHPAPPLPDAKTLPQGFSRIIERSLAKNPAHRYQTAADMLAELQEIAQRLRTGSAARRRALGRRSPAVRFPRRAATLSLAAGVLAALFCIWWWPLEGRYRIMQPAWFNSSTTQRATFDGNVRLAAISPGGRFLAYVLATGEIRLRSLADGADARVTSISDDCPGVTFAPNGRSLFWVVRDRKTVTGRLYRVALPSSLPAAFGIPALLLEDIDGPIAFSPDGQQFAFVRRTEEANGDNTMSILVAPAANSRNGRTIVTLAGTQIREQLAWSPRGDQIAAVVFAQRLDKSSRAEVMLFSPTGQLLRTVSANSLRKLADPVWLNGPLLAFIGTPQNSNQTRLFQLSTPTGRFHEVPPGILNFDSLSATSDGRTLALVGSDQRSSIWVADGSNPDVARRLTPDSEAINSLAWTDGGQLIYPSARTGNLNLWLASESGSSPIAAGVSCVEDWPSAASRSSSAVYSSNCSAGGDEFNLWRLDFRSGQRRQLTDGPTFDYQPDVSPDGRWVFYTSWPSNVPSIWKVPLSGGTPVPVTSGQARFPSISPQGDKLLCETRSNGGAWQVSILDLATSAVLARLPDLPVDSPPRWSPDGIAIDYLSAQPEANSSVNLWRQPLDLRRAPRQLTHLTENSITYFAWNRSGSKLAYVRARPASDVVLYRASR